MSGRIRLSAQLTFLRRWTGLLSISVQKAVTAGVLYEAGADLISTQLEPTPYAADLVYH